MWQSVKSIWTRLRTNWFIFAAGASSMLFAWHISKDRPLPAGISALLVLFFLSVDLVSFEDKLPQTDAIKSLQLQLIALDEEDIRTIFKNIQVKGWTEEDIKNTFKNVQRKYNPDNN